MRLTEQEAKGKWCPWAIIPTSLHVPRKDRADKIVAATGNRGTTMRQPYDGGQCLGSGCMAWRWVRTHVPDPNGDLIASTRTYGFCGLAGAADE